MTSTNGSRTRQLIETAARENGWEIEEYTQSVYAKRGDRVVNVIFTQAGGVNWAAAGTPVTGGHVAAGPDNPVFRGTGKCEQVLEYLRTHGSTDDAHPTAVVTSTNVKASTQIEGLGLYQYDQADFDYLMQHGQRTRASLVTEVLERTGDDHERDGYRTLVRKLRKAELAAMVAEWETGARENEAPRSAALVTNVSDLSLAMRAVLTRDRIGQSGSTATIAALEDRGLIEYSATSNCYLFTDAGRRARVALARLGEQVQAEQPGPPRFVQGAATPGYEVDAVMPASVTYCGTQPTPQSPPYAYGFLRSAVLGQAAGRPFADPVAAVRHLDECLRLAGYSVPTMEG